MDETLLSKCRELGEARLKVASEAKSTEDWIRLWKDPAHPYIFSWGSCWKFCTEYTVDDYPAEIGFFLDVIGCDSNALSHDFAMLTNAEGEFFFAVKPAGPGKATPPDALRLQFMLGSLLHTANVLQKRGIRFESYPEPCEPGSGLYRGSFRTPHGIAIDIWGVVPDGQRETAQPE